MKIAITGSKGVLGSILMKELSKHTLFEINRDICDLRNLSQLSQVVCSINPDAIVHCAVTGGKQQLGNFNANELHDNLLIFQNLKLLNKNYGVLINLGSGAEFDITQPICNATEHSINTILPKDSYGLSKNLISRTCQDVNGNTITLRIFGCFDDREPSYRLLKNFTKSIKDKTQFILSNDRKFSWISAKDLSKLIEYAAENWEKLPMDINCAYSNPLLLSEFLQKWCKLHNVSVNFNIANCSNFDYTCNNDLMIECMNVDLSGLEQSLGEYH